MDLKALKAFFIRYKDANVVKEIEALEKALPDAKEEVKEEVKVTPDAKK